jgi:hypothetical protein
MERNLRCAFFLVLLLQFNATTVQSFLPIRYLSNASIIRTSNTANSFRASTSSLQSASEMHTAYEYIARQRGKPTSECIKWIDPSQNIVPSPPAKQMGFDIEAKSAGTDASMGVHGKSDAEDDPMTLRVPIYPVSAVHLPSSAFHTLHNTEFKNIKMARDLNANEWTITLNGRNQSGGNPRYDEEKNGAIAETKHKCFVLTLLAQDTGRIASIGTLMEVIHMKETYANDKTLIRIVVECRAIDTVQIQGLEREAVGSPNDYLIGKVTRLGEIQNTNYPPPIDPTLLDIRLNQIVEDYAAVRSMYIHTDGVASRELPPYARDAVQSNLPAFTKEDFVRQFWNVAECWQMLCNTVREARRSELQAEMNEIMVDAASKKKGPLQLPVKRTDLPEDVQVLLGRMEKKQSEDFLSCGMDACLDFQALLGMRLKHEGNCHKIQTERILFLGDLIKREKERLDMKERLKQMFDPAEESSDLIDTSSSNSHTRTKGGGEISPEGNHFE